MLQKLKNLVRPGGDRPLPAIPSGERIYAVGDIHGRRDLFDALIAAIEADDTDRGQAATTIVLLGDLVDRGADSRGVIEAARALGKRRKVRCIAGNHEEMFLKCFDDLELFRHFLRYGGRETVLSYPVSPQAWHAAPMQEAQDMMRRAVPDDDLAYLRGFEDQVEVGDYLFVHAGVRPGTPLNEQRQADLRWIREPFLSHHNDFGKIIVHGHTIGAEPVVHRNRIGIDTGAYASGMLTALGLEGAERWLLNTREDGATIATETRPV